MTPTEVLKQNLTESISAKTDFLRDSKEHKQFELASKAIYECYLKGGRIYIAGNGGSAADAQHLAAEFVSRLAKEREPMAAEALTVDSSILTAIGNDYGFNEIFSRQIIGKMRQNDIFLGITTSGNSKNIVRAFETCRELGLVSIAFSGHDGGLVKALANYCITAKGVQTSTIQETHIVLAHSLCEYIESELIKHSNQKSK